MLRLVKFIQSESTLVDTRGWEVERVERGNGELVFNGDEVLV